MTTEAPIPQESGRTKLAEGKTKIIWSTDDPKIVTIESKDDITAGDGARRDIIEGKAEIATATTCNVFETLTRAGIPNHFLRRGQNGKSFDAIRLKMLPFEIVTRNIATGSYLQRHPKVAEGYQFQKPVVEFFFKDDSLHDPIADFDGRGWVNLYDAHNPYSTRGGVFSPHEGLLKSIPLKSIGMSYADVIQMQSAAIAINDLLREKWAEQNIALVDMKTEEGFDSDGNLMTGDVIDNDSWRLWPGGQKALMLDKQVYRNIPKPTQGQIADIKTNYKRVAEMTALFLH